MCYNKSMGKINKRCPRCDTKMPIGAMVCPGCELNFNKFNSATNRAGKIALREGRKDDVIYRKGCPKDVHKTRLLLLTIFLGFTGAHNYFVGRYRRGLFYTIFFLVGLTNSVLSVVLQVTATGLFGEILTILLLVWGAVLVMWLFDVINVIFNKFKIPVSVELK